MFKIFKRKEKDSSIIKKKTVNDALNTTKTSFFSKFKSIFKNSTKFNLDQLDELESLLISSDIGVKTTSLIIDSIKSDQNIKSDQELTALIKNKLTEVIDFKSLDYDLNTEVLILSGVNGAGKTTTSAKLARKYSEQGKKVLLVAADTFRAGAVDQLYSWGKEIGIDVFTSEKNMKPQAVIFDAFKLNTNNNYDLIIIDTAGRLNNKKNLLLELQSIGNTVKKFNLEAKNILVVDGNSGQNALSQANDFNNTFPIDGFIITKLDGTPRGGMVFALMSEFQKPVYFLGTGESEQDIQEFNFNEFISSFFNQDDLIVQSNHHANKRKRIRRSD